MYFKFGTNTQLDKPVFMKLICLFFFLRLST